MMILQAVPDLVNQVFVEKRARIYDNNITLNVHL